MYLSKIELHNIRCFDDLTIDLEKDNQFILWTTILGNNAVGKSTILKCIAMGLCDETSASALLKESKGEILRKGDLSGYIKLYLKRNTTEKEAIIATHIMKSTKDSPEKLRQSIEGNLTQWKDVFFCGYNVRVRDGGGDAFENYRPLEAVYTLFNNNSDLQNPELILLRQDEYLRKILSEKLLNILMLDGNEIEHSNRGMFVTGPRGKFRIDDLSDGYLSTTQWVVDLFGWAIIADRLSAKSIEIEGILLIDELETHLHPKWQRNIVDRLRKQFPRVQIIIASHSPIIALGTADLIGALMVELEFDPIVENVSREREVDAEEYRGLTVDQILMSPPFNLPIARSGVTGDKILRFQELLLKKSLSPNEQDEYEILKATIKELPDVYETMENLRIHNEIRKLLAEDINDSNKK